MFPFQQSDDVLVSQISFNTHQEDITQQDLVALGGNYNYLPMNMEKGQPHNTIFSTSNNNDQPSNLEDNERKIMRRDNERQRRQQMAFLTSSLRSLLPLEMIKVKNPQLFFS